MDRVRGGCGCGRGRISAIGRYESMAKSTNCCISLSTFIYPVLLFVRVTSILIWILIHFRVCHHSSSS
jgi:hypothetical protein